MSRLAPKLALVFAALCVSSAAALRFNLSKETEAGAVAESLAASALAAELPPEFNTSRLRILADLQYGRPGGEDEAYDCESFPHMCRAPFHCESWSAQDTLDVRMHGLAAKDGHANLRSWCLPGLERYAGTVLKECIANGDMRQSAQVAKKRTFDDWADELDASYCFAEGHCTHRAVTDNTTLDEMEEMCDWRYGGRKGWTRNFLKTMKRLFDMPDAFNRLANTMEGYKTHAVTKVISKMACAQGIFHCDVQYCKQTYCRDEYYVAKYKHLLPPVPGDKVQDPDISKSNRNDF